MKYFTMIDGKFYELRDGEHVPLPFPDVLEIFEAAAQEVSLGTTALEEMNGHANGRN